MSKRQSKIEMVNYAKRHINSLSLANRKLVLNLIAYDLGVERIKENADGCYISVEIHKDISDETLDDILDLIVREIENEAYDSSLIMDETIENENPLNGGCEESLP